MREKPSGGGRIMHSGYCIACGSGLTIRRDEGPRRAYSCSNCIRARGEALECTDCRLRFNGIPGKSPCPRCLENILAEKGVFVEFKGVRV